MLTLNFETLVENPSNIYTHCIQPPVNQYVLLLAIRAATYCAQREWILCRAAREGFYKPPEWKPLDWYPDVHEINEDRALEAEKKRAEFVQRYRFLFADND